MKDRDTGKK